MNEKLISLIKTIELNSRLVNNCFENIDQSTAENRINNKTNSMIFILIHLVDARYFFLKIIGSEIQSPYFEITKNIKSIEGFKEYPPLNEILEAWNKSTELLINNFKSINSEKLNSLSEIKFPINDDTLLGSITFGVQHESFHIGQLSLLRKHFGFPAMSYN